MSHSIRYQLRQWVNRLLRGKQTCPRRMDEMGPHERVENLDTWDKRGRDRTCSFCGSCHPDDFLRFVNDVIDNPDPHIRIEMSDKNYKVYMHYKHSEDGAIKFYVMHMPRVVFDRTHPTVVRALQISKEKFATLCKTKFAMLRKSK